jgi:hypothetical protein
MSDLSSLDPNAIVELISRHNAAAIAAHLYNFPGKTKGLRAAGCRIRADVRSTRFPELVLSKWHQTGRLYRPGMTQILSNPLIFFE